MIYRKLISIVAALTLSTISPVTQAIPVKSCMEDSCVIFFNKWQSMVKVKGALALSALGELYYQGYGTEKNLEKSIKSFRKASHYKFAHAQYRAGVFYLMEDNFIDNKEGIRYLRKAARNGHTESAFLLAIIFGTGEFGIKDVGESDKWLGKALKNKHYVAQQYASYLYKSGQVDEGHYIKVNKIISELQANILTGNSTSSEGNIAKILVEIPWTNHANKTTNIPSSPSFEDMFDPEEFSFKSTKLEAGTALRSNNRSCEKIFSCYQVEQDDFWQSAHSPVGAISNEKTNHTN